MSPDPARTAERPAVLSFVPRTAGCERGGSPADSQLSQVSVLLARRLTDALCVPVPEHVGGGAGWT